MCGLADDITNTCVRNDELSIALSNDGSLELVKVGRGNKIEIKRIIVIIIKVQKKYVMENGM